MNLNEEEIQLLQGQKKTYYDMGYNNILEAEGVKMPDFVSADDFAALTEGFKGKNIRLDPVSGNLIVNDGEVDRIIIGVLPSRTT